jgi:hypothetical protein
MRLKVLTMPAALLLLLCLSCHSLSRKGPSPAQNGEMEKADVQQSIAGSAVDADSVAPKGNVPASAPAPAAHQDWDKKIVKTADLSIEVKSFPSFTNRLHQAVQQSGGYIAGEQQIQSSYSIENTVTIKVPVDRFDDLLLQLPSDSDRLTEKKMNSEDVTMEVIDTKSRLETKKEVRERYLDLLKQARNMKDILAIQGEIDEIQEEMDAAAGRIAYLGHSASFSTINLKFYQVLNPGVQEDAPPSFLYKISQSLKEGWSWGSNVLLGLCTLWPIWVMCLLGWMLWRRMGSRLPKRAAGTRT